MQSENFARVVEALERELGAGRPAPEPQRRACSRPTRPAIVGGRAGPRPRSTPPAAPRRTTSARRTRPARRRCPSSTRRRWTGSPRPRCKETGEPVESLTLLRRSNRQWTVYMLRGEPDSFIANLNGKGLRLSRRGEPRAGRRRAGLAAAREEPPEGAGRRREGGRPRARRHGLARARARSQVEKGGRVVSLHFGYDAELTNRDVSRAQRRPDRHDPAQAHRRRRRSSGWPRAST